MICLAVGEPSGLYLALLMAELVVNVGMGVGLYWVGNKAAKIDKLEDRLSVQSEKTITAMFDNYTSSLRFSMNEVSSQIQQFNKRLDEGDGDLRDLVKRDREDAIGLERRFGEMRNWMTEKFVTSDELQRHQDSVSGEFKVLERDLKACATQMAVLNSHLARQRRN